MEKRGTMNYNKLILSQNYINRVRNKISNYRKNGWTKEEIDSEIINAIIDCSISFKTGSFIKYLIKVLNVNLAKRYFDNKNCVPIHNNIRYNPENPSISILKNIPKKYIDPITEFIYGKITKKEAAKLLNISPSRFDLIIQFIETNVC